MNNRFYKQILCISIGALLILAGCVYTPIKGVSEKRTIDATYLSFWYKRQIIPAFSNYQLKTKEMLQAAYALKDTEEGAEREAAMGHLKELYKEAFLSLQDVIIFDHAIFHSGVSGVYELAGTSQVNKTLVKSAIENGRFSSSEIIQELEEGLNQPNATGFAAMDYMLYSGEIPLDAACIQYICTVCEVINHYAKAAESYYVENENAFVSNNDFSARGSLCVLINTLMKQYEVYIRTIKVGIPIGIYGAAIVQKKPAPQAVEGYYCGKGLSTQLLHRSILALKNFYNGVPYNESMPLPANSFRRFMEEQLAVSGKGDNGLINLFGKTLDVLEGETGNLNHDDIAVLVNTPDGMERLKEIYGELQKVVGLLKAKLIVELNLTVTYTDGEEGD